VSSGDDIGVHAGIFFKLKLLGHVADNQLTPAHNFSRIR
jgi:hypothetical protein